VRRSVACVAVAAALVLAGCGSPSDSKGVASSNDSPLWQTPSIAPSSPAASPSPVAPSPSPSPSASAATVSKAVTYTFPVIGNNGYGHTHHDYPATDIITNCGNRVVAVTSGVILDTTTVDKWKRSVNAGATRGGLSVSILGDDGVRYYGSHMSVVDAKIKPGARVSTGQTLGKIGDTGDASACHLHFGISPPCAKVGDWWTQRGAIYPWPYLDAWKKHVNKSAVSAVAAWKTQHGCPKKPLVDP
jgi:murein DD-endopeptidase MepM/ murein hydrolase activator NlpD